MLVTEKPTGRMYIVTSDGKKSAPIAGLPKVDARDQGGLLDVELPPDHDLTGEIFWSYYEPRKGGNGLAVARGRLVDGKPPRVTDVKVVFRMKPTMETTMHAGGRMVFASDGTLFIGLGERSILRGRVQAQDLRSHFGKIVRIRPDGTVPRDNPFAGKKGALPETWSLGHRNVLAIAFDAGGRLWVAEMGPLGGDELNLVERGKDYGWPTIGYGKEYDGRAIHKSTQAAGMEQPRYYWDPVISPGALAIYSGKLIPEWKGNFLIAGLSSKALIRLVVDEKGRVTGEERLLEDRRSRVREVLEGPDGALYLLTDESNGQLLKLTPR
jgi:glucose/arabinose dehydrogenase